MAASADDPAWLRAIIFDVDGTLVDSLAAYQTTAHRVAAAFGWQVPDDAIGRALNHGEPFWAQIIPPEVQHDGDLPGQLRAEALRHWAAVAREAVALIPGVAPLLAGLRESGLRLAICTASRGESFAPLEQAGLLRHFEVVVTGADVGRPKPDPEGLHLCLSRLGLASPQALFVGDSVADMRAGVAAGLRAIGVLTGAGARAELVAAGAHHVADDHDHLGRLILGGSLAGVDHGVEAKATRQGTGTASGPEPGYQWCGPHRLR